LTLGGVVFCVFFSLVLKSFVAKYRFLSFESPLLVLAATTHTFQSQASNDWFCSINDV